MGPAGVLVLTAAQAPPSSVVTALAPGGFPLFSAPACAAAAGSVAVGADGRILLGGAGCLITYTAEGAPSFAQSWSAALTGVAVDGAGNLVVAGTLAGTIDLGGGSIGSSGASILLAKLGPTGELIFGEAFPVPGIYTPTLITVALGPSGDIVLAGNVAAGADFGGGPLPGEGYGVSVAIFDPGGHHLSSHGYYSADGEAYPSRVRLDVSGHVVLGGYFYGTVDFGSGPLSSAGVDDGFVARLSP